MKICKRRPTLKLTVGLLVLLLTGGCSHNNDDECEITCSDGFKTSTEESCSHADVTAYNQVHGNCRFTTILNFNW